MASEEELWKIIRNASGGLKTRCIVCRQELTDAPSIDRGIGPVCSSRFGSNPQPIGEDRDEWIRTLLPLVFSQEYLDIIMSHYTKDSATFTRQLANATVYWLSRYGQSLIKSQLGNAIRLIFSLGFTRIGFRVMTEYLDYRQDPKKGIVKHPYAKKVIPIYKDLLGVWDPNEYAWVFPEEAMRWVYQIYLAYRTGDLDEWMAAMMGEG